MAKINVIDLFAGCGGLSEGFMKFPEFNLVAFIDWNEDSLRTLKHNLVNKWNIKDADKRVIKFDLQRHKELLFGWEEDDEFPSHYYSKTGINKIKDEHWDVDVIIGGPPCQAYSVAGRIRDDNGMEDDYRNYLFESYIKLVDFFKPKLFIFENVPGMLSAKPGGKLVTDRIKKAFAKHGYIIIDDIKSKALFDCSKYGVPQKRKRVILLGLNKEHYGNETEVILQEFYDSIMPRLQSKKIKTVKDTIKDLPCFYPGDLKKHKGKKYSHEPVTTNVENHYPRFHNKRDVSIFKKLALDIHKGENKYSNVEALKKLYTEKTGKTSAVHKYHVLRWNEPSNTIPAHLKKDGLRHIHPDFQQARSITVREAARLQSFDDDFVFLGSQSEQYRMIGDAVPPIFSEKLANAVSIILNSK